LRVCRLQTRVTGFAGVKLDLLSAPFDASARTLRRLDFGLPTHLGADERPTAQTHPVRSNSFVILLLGPKAE
jgi:hypothetical protein